MPTDFADRVPITLLVRREGMVLGRAASEPDEPDRVVAIGAVHAGRRMRASEFFQAIHAPATQAALPPLHHGPDAYLCACDPVTCVPLNPLELLPDACNRPMKRRKPSPLQFAIAWIHKRTGIALHDLQNYAERARCGCRWGEYKVQREILELPTGTFRFGELPPPDCRVMDETLPCILHVADQMEDLERNGTMAALLHALWIEYPIELVELGLPKPRPPQGEPFLPTELQVRILTALEGQALSGKQLRISLNAKNTLYKSGGIAELISRGDVAHHKRIGYYRPDRLPAKHADVLSAA